MVLGGGLGLLAGLFSPNWPGIFAQEPPADSSFASTETIELETLIARLRPEARRLIASDKPDEEKYLEMAIKELLAVNKLDTNRFMESGNDGWEMDFQAFVPPVLLCQIRMSPNSVIDCMTIGITTGH